MASGRKRNFTGHVGSAAGFGWLLCPRWTLSAGFDSADDGDSGAGRWSEKYPCVSPRPRPEVLAAAGMLGVTEFYLVGGAQAIAALAYGTSSIPRVDKIVGPGNLFVTAAKKLVSFDCAIDMLAGPTEALIVSDEGHPQYIAADLVCQAEHDPETQVAFITTKRRLADAVALCVKEVAEENPIAKKSLAKTGAILIASSKALALDWANRIASEHLTVSIERCGVGAKCGSVFVGDYSAAGCG